MSAPVVLVRRPVTDRAMETLRARSRTAARIVDVEPGDLAAAAAAAAPDDVVVLDGDVVVADGWLEGLQAAAESDSTVATAGAVVVDEGDDAPPRVEAAPLARAPEGVPRCCWIRRRAIELAGPLDAGFWERCVERGAIHLEAGEVVAVAVDGVRAVRDPADVSGSHPRPPGPRERSRALARRRRKGAEVTIDGRVLTGVDSGTQVHALALVRALARVADARFRVLLPSDPAPDAVSVLAELGVETLLVTELDDAPRSPVVHRPHQVSGEIDFIVLGRVGERLVVTHQDLLLFHNPAYHRDRETWGAYRRLTASALGVADLVVANSRHTAADLVAEDLVAHDRIRCVPLGTDHVLAAPGDGAPPAVARVLAGRPFLLCIGSDLRHKNRPFAMDLLAALRRRSWSGALVLAGPHVRYGSSADEESRRLEADPQLATMVVKTGPVDDRERAWLYEHAAAVAYPTTYEGFGLVPFEAAAFGTPCLFAAQASLAEAVGREALLVPWDADASAERVLPVLTDPAAAERQVAALRTAGRALTWDAAASRLAELYDEALEVPPPERTGANWRALEAETQRAEWESRYWAIGRTGLSLVAGDRALPEDVQRTLSALAAREPTRRAMFAAARALRRAARVAR